MLVSRPEGHIPFPRAQKSHVHPSMPAVPIRRSVTWTGIGDALYAACQWGLLMVLARLGTPEMVGQFALALAVTAPVIIFSNLGLRPLQSTDACHQFAFGDYLTLRLSTNDSDINHNYGSFLCQTGRELREMMSWLKK